MKNFAVKYFTYQKNRPFDGYSLVAKIFHWFFFFFFAYATYKSIDDIQQLEDISLLKLEIVFASIFLLLLFIRFVYMARTQTSSLPENTHIIQKVAAKIVHLGVYVSMALIAITGLIIGGLYYAGLKQGIIMDAFVGMHEISVVASYWFIGVHISAAIYHRFKKDGVWNSMVPFLKEK
jgi:cytochrome b561